MRIIFKATSALLTTIRLDLGRPHPFAHERVGFIAAGLAASGHDVIAIARSYRAVADGDYLPDPTVGAMMGPDAVRAAMQWAMDGAGALFHVHTHGGRGIPEFSGVDVRENAKFVPDFFKVAPRCAHGALVLSGNAARGAVWLERKGSSRLIDAFVEIGMPLRKWRVS